MRLEELEGGGKQDLVLHFDKIKHGPPRDPIRLHYEPSQAMFVMVGTAEAEHDEIVSHDKELREILVKVISLLSADYAEDGASGDQIARDLRPMHRNEVLGAVRMGIDTRHLHRQKRTGRGGGWAYFVSVQ
jgi:hypothetical protein